MSLTPSSTMTRPFGRAASAHRFSSAVASASGQSASTLCIMYTVGPGRERIELWPETTRPVGNAGGVEHLLHAPLRGRSASVLHVRPAFKTAAKIHVPSPKSTTVRMEPQSAGSIRTCGSGSPCPGPIIASNFSARSGCASRSSQNGRPNAS